MLGLCMPNAGETNYAQNYAGIIGLGLHMHENQSILLLLSPTFLFGNIF